MSSNETSLEKLHKGHVGAQVIFTCFSENSDVLKETFIGAIFENCSCSFTLVLGSLCRV